MEKSNFKSIKKIAFVGPESTGKSTLANALALEYNDVLVPEFARQYIAELSNKYTLTDIDFIAQQQLLHEQLLTAKATNFLFCDTTLLVTKIWAANAFQTELKFIESNYFANDYSVHFLCNVDFAWVFDPQREHPEENQRQFFFNWYKNELKKSNANHYIVSGTLQQRINFCKKIISKL